MAQPIPFHVPQKPVANLEHLGKAPAEHADAVIAAYELLQLLHDKGILSLLRGFVGAGDEIAGIITKSIDSPNAIRGFRNFLLLTNFFSRMPPEVLSSFVDAIHATGRNKAQNAPGLLHLLWRLRSENSRRAASVGLDLLEAAGKSSMTDSIVHTPVGKVAGRLTSVCDDVRAVEAPLGIRLRRTSISVTMHAGHACPPRLFDARNELASLREDIGRHNAVDKLTGSLLRGTLPLQRVNSVAERASEL